MPAATALHRVLERYALYGEIASGGMASVHYGRFAGPAGFSRTVAIKQLHPHLARDPEFVEMFLREARLAARVRHPNVVSTLDVVSLGGEVFLVMEFVLGETLAGLLRTLQDRGECVQPPMASAIMIGALHGLHAAHEATGDQGTPLEIVHRDVSPQNIMLTVEGSVRVLDFGVAKASHARDEQTREGALKGKLGYVAPEQLEGGPIDRRVDVYAAAVVLWEMLAGERLFGGATSEARLHAILHKQLVPPGAMRSGISPELDRSSSISSGNIHTCAALEDGRVACWGKGVLRRPSLVMGLSEVDEVAAGGRHTCVLRSDSTVWCWGFNEQGQLGNASTDDTTTPAQVSGLQGAKAVAAGDAHACALLASGRVACWGSNVHGELGRAPDNERHPQPVELTTVTGPPCP